jgi:hypothetical protein
MRSQRGSNPPAIILFVAILCDTLLPYKELCSDWALILFRNKSRRFAKVLPYAALPNHDHCGYFLDRLSGYASL